MRWPPWARRFRRAGIPATGSDPVDVADAVASRQRAEALLERDRYRGQEVREVAARARELRARNHLAQLIADSFQGRQT